MRKREREGGGRLGGRGGRGREEKVGKEGEKDRNLGGLVSLVGCFVFSLLVFFFKEKAWSWMDRDIVRI